jgi:hypothetical protein
MFHEMFNQVRLPVDLENDEIGPPLRVWIEDRGLVAVIDPDGNMIFRPKVEVAAMPRAAYGDDAFPADARQPDRVDYVRDLY